MMEHLLNSFSYKKVLWQNHEKLFGHMDRDQLNKQQKMVKENILEPHLEPSLEYLPRILAMGGVEGEESENF